MFGNRNYFISNGSVRKGEKAMYYGRYVNEKGETRDGIYYRLEEFYKDTFSPLSDQNILIKFSVHGKRFIDKQNSLRNLAIEWSYLRDDSTLSWLEISIINQWFEKNGRRYGLLREFRENAIC